MPELPVWGWILLAWLACMAMLAVGWGAAVWRERRTTRNDWLAGLRRRVADPVDRACAEMQAALAQDVHEEFVRIARTMPELARPNPRLYALYPVPGKE